MCILGSRAHYCINNSVLEKSQINGKLQKDKVNELCAELRSSPYCHYKRDTSRAENALRLARVWDIEDAVKIVESHFISHHLTRCPFYNTIIEYMCLSNSSQNKTYYSFFKFYLIASVIMDGCRGGKNADAHITPLLK
jgi:hypothetical protein